jgi:radical SAM superfamily enzyme YgiQ (UPF0313 family)
MNNYFRYEEPLFRPPSEAQSLIIQATIGCSQNSCKFCGMYKMKQFRIRPVNEIISEISSVPLQHRQYIQRVFIADGDALIYPQQDLHVLLDALAETFPRLNRIGAYASPNSLNTKCENELAALQEKKLRILYFGLESGDPETLTAVNKGFTPEQMLSLCLKAQKVGMKLSITAILGLAGQARSTEHAIATADWINALSPEYFSLLTMFKRHNDDWFKIIKPLTHGQVLEEVLIMLHRLDPRRTILRSNHVSNFLNLAGSYPKDRQRLIDVVEVALAEAYRHPAWFNEISDYHEKIY